MEIVGGVASIITLIEATGVLAKVSRDLVIRWRDAPHVIRALATRLSLLAAELQNIRSATAKSHPVLTNAIIRQILSDLLTEARERLSKLESLHLRLHKHGPTRQKVQWATKDAAEVEKMLSKTHEVEQRLANIMTLISVRAQTPILDRLDRIEQMISTLAMALPAATYTTQATSLSAPITSNSVAFSTTLVRKGRVLASVPWDLHRCWKAWGVRGSFISTTHGHDTNHTFSFAIRLPLAKILGCYLVTATVSLRSTPPLRNALTLRHPSYFAIARVVDEDHPFIQACRRDDLELVRSMLMSGEGRPTDMASGARSPMFYAVNNGSLNVVAELLNSGIEIDAEINPWMSNATIVACMGKHLDVVRLLLDHGASPDFIDLNGLNPAISCWFESDEKTKYPSSDVANLLRQRVDLDFRACDKFGKTALHHAALLGANGPQIDTLIKMGADIHQVDHRGMKPIHLAALGGNDLALAALEPRYCPSATGGAGPTCIVSEGLLHLAVIGRAFHWSDAESRDLRLEYDKVVKFLLQRGADTKAQVILPRAFLDRFTTEEVRNKIYARAVTAATLSAVIGPITETWCLGLLLQCGFLDQEEDIVRLHELEEAGYACSRDQSEDDYEISGDIRLGCDSNDISQIQTHDDFAEKCGNDSVASAGERTGWKDDEQFWDAEERA